MTTNTVLNTTTISADAAALLARAQKDEADLLRGAERLGISADELQEMRQSSPSWLHSVRAAGNDDPEVNEVAEALEMASTGRPSAEYMKSQETR
jgi:hypothetical protein